MAKINASLASVSTDFLLVEPGLYDFEVEEYKEILKDNEWIASTVKSRVVAGENEDQIGRKIQDYIHIKKPGEPFDPETNIGLKNIKRYFEICFGKEEVKGWTDDDFDTDLLKGRRFSAQVAISSYTPKGQTEPRSVNEYKRMEELD